MSGKANLDGLPRVHHEHLRGGRLARVQPSLAPFLLFCCVTAMFLSGCKTPPSAAEIFEAQRVRGEIPPARDGMILVFVDGGPVENKGRHWFPEGSSLATVLDWAGLDPLFPPRNVYVIDIDGRKVTYRIARESKANLEQIKIAHGSRLIVPHDRCFGIRAGRIDAA